MAKGKKKTNKNDDDDSWMFDGPPATSTKGKKSGGDDVQKQIDDEKAKLMSSMGLYAGSPIYNSYVDLKKYDEDRSADNAKAEEKHDFDYVYDRLRLLREATPFYLLIMGDTRKAEMKNRVNRCKSDGRKTKTNEAIERRGSF